MQYPSFQKMIHIASRATNGVKIADLRNTREGIKRAFKQQMTALRTKLNVRMIALSARRFTHMVFAEQGRQGGGQSHL